MARLILELLDAEGAVRSRQRLDTFPVTIGRGFANDVILDDPYVCASHARIVRDDSGAIMVEDTGSVNGIRPQGSNGTRNGRGAATASARSDRIALQPGMEVVVGRTRLRVRDRDEPVAAAVPDGARLPFGERVIAAFDSSRAAVLLLAAMVVTFSGFVYLSRYTRLGPSVIVGSLLMPAILALAYAGVWALVSRVSTHASSFRAHLAIGSAAILSVLVVMPLMMHLVFLWPHGVLADLLITVLMTPLLAFVLSAHLAYASRMRPRRRWITAAATIVGLVALGGVEEMIPDNDFTRTLEFSADLAPIDPRYVPAISVEEFTKELAPLKTEVDRIASE